MYRLFIALSLTLGLLSAACRNPAAPTAPPSPAFVALATPSAEPTAAPSPAPPTPNPSPTPPPTAEPTVSPPLPDDDLALSAENIFLYPTPRLHVGDRVTFQLHPRIPPGLDPEYIAVRILIDGDKLLDGSLGRLRNLAGEPLGVFPWVWLVGDRPRTATVTVWLDPDDQLQAGDENPHNNRIDLEVEIAPRPVSQDQQHWETVRTAWANLHVVSGTAAARDRDALAVQVDVAVQRAAAALGVTPNRPIDFYLVDRVIGHGGYASSSIVITYTDRNYAGGALAEALVHEAVHVLERQFVNGASFAFLTEGLAVWAAGGHYKPEKLDQRAAGLLLDTNRYLPLPALIDNFYPSQHEIGYLQAGAFIGYLVNTYGWARVQTFYANLSNSNRLSPSQALDQNLSYHFGKTLAQLEQDWHAYLRAQPRTAEEAQDLLLTVEYYETVRRYQQLFDPSAHFMTGWLPTPEALLSYNLTADLTRRPDELRNRVLEIMLGAADQALRRRDYGGVRALLSSINRSLDAGGQFADPLAERYDKLVQTAEDLGFLAEQIAIETPGDRPIAVVLARTADQPALVRLTLTQQDSQWVVSR